MVKHGLPWLTIDFHGYPCMAVFRDKMAHSHRCPLGILQRIHSIQRIQRNRSKSQQKIPMVPHAGEQDDGSFLQNSFKLTTICRWSRFFWCKKPWNVLPPQKNHGTLAGNGGQDDDPRVFSAWSVSSDPKTANSEPSYGQKGSVWYHMAPYGILMVPHEWYYSSTIMGPLR